MKTGRRPIWLFLGRITQTTMTVVALGSYLLLARRRPTTDSSDPWSVDDNQAIPSGGRTGASIVTTAKDEDRYIAIWSKAVDTQMHFNEMSVKSRQLGLTFVAAALGTALVLLSRGEDFALPIEFGHFEIQIHVSVIMVIAASLALSAVKGLDLNVYHRMLRGAVTFGEDFEEQYMKRIFDLDKGMTQAISHYSRHDDAKATTGIGPKRYSGSSPLNAEQKIRRFYRHTNWFLWISAAILFSLTNVPAWITGADDAAAATEAPPLPASEPAAILE